MARQAENGAHQVMFLGHSIDPNDDNPYLEVGFKVEGKLSPSGDIVEVNYSGLEDTARVWLKQEGDQSYITRQLDALGITPEDLVRPDFTIEGKRGKVFCSGYTPKKGKNKGQQFDRWSLVPYSGGVPRGPAKSSPEARAAVAKLFGLSVPTTTGAQSVAAAASEEF